MFRTVLVLLLLLVCGTPLMQARHKCPKVPSPPGVLGIFSSTTLIPSGSTMAAARSSETSGCGQGHPSGDFYKPQRARVTLFLQNNLPQVREESAQGQGSHLNALALLAGCPSTQFIFGQTLQKHYTQIFRSEMLNNVETTTERLLSLIAETPALASGCESG